jgi:hypothetical protein
VRVLFSLIAFKAGNNDRLVAELSEGQLLRQRRVIFAKYYLRLRDYLIVIGYDLFKSRELAQEVVREVFLKLANIDTDNINSSSLRNLPLT